MKTKLFLIAIFFSQIALSQTIYKSSIDNGGASVSNANISLLYTIGEVNVREVTAGNISISEGFIGPRRIPEISFNKNFVTGWNWFSVNVLNDDMSLGNLLTCASEGDYVKNQTESATYYNIGGWYGSLATSGLDPSSLYKIKTINPCDASYTGAAVDVLSTPIDLVPGWNWIGYLPQCELQLSPVNEALASLTLEQEDYVKNQTESATYYDIGGWYGSLLEMSPTEGYMFKKQSADQIIYPECPPGATAFSPDSRKSAVSEKITQDASFNPHNFEFNGTVTATVYVEGALAGGENDLIMAYVDEELRGISEGLYFEPSSTYAFPIMVYSNMAVGETISFKYYDADSKQLFFCNETLVFSKDMIVDNAFESFELNISSALGVDLPIDHGLSLDVYPNPFRNHLQIEYSIAERTKVRLAVYDVLGKPIKILEERTLDPGEYSTLWNSQNNMDGTYIIMMTTQNSTMRQVVFLIR